MAHSFTWPLGIALYLFLAGVSAGAFGTATVASFAGPRYRSTVRWGALIAPLPVIVGLGMLVLDLGAPSRFYMLLYKWNFTSMMSMGAQLVTVFSIFTVLFAWYMLDQDRATGLRALPGRTWFRVTGLALSLGVAGYTGFLLSASNGVALWNNGLIPVLFLVSALSTGIAAVMIALGLTKGQTEAEQADLLGKVDAAFIVFELMIILGFLWSLFKGGAGGYLALTVLNEEYSMLFWGGVVVLGLLVPLTVKLISLGHKTTVSYKPAITGALVLAGGLFLRVVVLYAGQAANLYLTTPLR